MMIRTKTSGCLALLLLAAGCAADPQSSGQLADRLSSAREITTFGPRQSALAQIAHDAAYAGEADLCLRSVDDMAPSGLRDQTAVACAASFDRMGRRDKADALVARVDSPVTRNQLREAYAAQPAPPRSN